VVVVVTTQAAVSMAVVAVVAVLFIRLFTDVEPTGAAMLAVLVHKAVMVLGATQTQTLQRMVEMVEALVDLPELLVLAVTP
jgi:nucleoside-diphosphate-sugar epimerase